MRTKCAAFIIGVFALVGFASHSFAGDRLGSYLALKGGINSPSSSFTLRNIGIDHNSFNANTSNGFDGELALGHYVLPTLALELGVGYLKGKGSISTTPVHDVNYNVIPVVVTAKALIPVGAVDPYGELGIGAYFTRFKVSDNLNTFSGTTTFGMHAGVGMNVNITPHAFLGVEGRYVNANPSFGNQKVKLNDTEYSLNGFKLNGFTTTLDLGFSF